MRCDIPGVMDTTDSMGIIRSVEMKEAEEQAGQWTGADLQRKWRMR